MKAQIGVRINPVNGFMNLDAAAKPDENDRIACDPFQVEQFIDANELEFFQINDLLDYLPLQARGKCLQGLLTRVAHGGVVVMTGLEPSEVARLIHNGSLDVLQLNNIIYGMGRKSMVSVADSIGVVLNTGQFDLESAGYDNTGLHYVIKFVRK